MDLGSGPARRLVIAITRPIIATGAVLQLGMLNFTLLSMPGHLELASPAPERSTPPNGDHIPKVKLGVRPDPQYARDSLSSAASSGASSPGRYPHASGGAARSMRA